MGAVLYYIRNRSRAQSISGVLFPMKKQYYKKFVLFSILIETDRQDVAEFFKLKPFEILLEVLNSKIIKHIGGKKHE